MSTATTGRMHDDLDDGLLERYCAGDCTPAERAEVERWIAADRSRAAHLQLLKAAWLESGAMELPSARERPDLAAAWQRVERRTRWADRPPLRMAGGASVPERGWRRLASWSALGAAAVVALAVGGPRIWKTLSGALARPTVMPQVATRRGHRASLRLSDGTRITLGPSSRIRYAVEASRGPRRVELEGAAYFMVTHDSTRPFTVHTARGIATDLGTRFAVRAYPTDSAVAVAVAEGSVALTASVDTLASRSASRTPDAPPERLVLSAGDVGRIAADGRLGVERDAGVERYLAWAEGRLVFRDAPLRDAVVELGRWYDLDLRLGDSTLGRRPLTASFKDEPASEVLHLIAASLNLRLDQRGRAVVLYP